MKLLIIGATGRTGQHVTAQAIDRGHSVTALVRTPNKLRPRERLNIIAGDPLRFEDVMAALPGHDAVISCIGHTGPNTPWLVSEAASVMLAAMDRLQVKRYVVLSGGLLFPSFNPAVLVLRFMLAKRLADARAMENVVCASNVDWTIIRPPHLKDGMAAKGYKVKWTVHQAMGGLVCSSQISPRVCSTRLKAENSFGRLSASPRRKPKRSH